MSGFDNPPAAGMDFAIAPVRRVADPPPGAGRGIANPEVDWAVLCIHERRGLEVVQHLARFGHRTHAEAFLADLLAAPRTPPVVQMVPECWP